MKIATITFLTVLLLAPLTGCYPARVDMLHNDLAMKTGDHGALFDLDADPGETTNLAESHGDVTGGMRKLAESYFRELGDEGRVGYGVRKAGFVEQARPITLSR